MAGEALRIVGRDSVERRPERLMQSFGGAGCNFAQSPLHLGPDRLDRVEIRRVSRQAAGAEPGVIEKLPHGLVSREVDGVDAPDGLNVPEWWRFRPPKEAFVDQVGAVGLDLAKHVFQAHGADGAGAVVFRRKLRRGQVLSFFAALPPCTVAMEACAGARHWGREIVKLGHSVRPIAPAYVKPFVKRPKNDTADAEAICEAAQRPTMRFVAVKSEETQAAIVVFRTRDLLVRQRTRAINALRGPFHIAKLVKAIEDPACALPDVARAILAVLVEEIRSLDGRIAGLDREIARQAKENARAG